ncbi:DNA mismatch repair endonuclease MutL [Candidatus Hydrogenedentota bacterium]
MPRITVLPEAVANMIAAGEVVERPASVVKELVENSLDAGASRIDVLVLSGGRKEIEIIDNGCGMSRDDALLAIERHATSKIRNAADLDSIQTFGFRGEALPSIAAVSRFELSSRPEDKIEGVKLSVSGGVIKDVTSHGMPIGTRIRVSNLYFNTPARRKFLRTAETELGHILDAVERHSVANIDVAFRVHHNDKIILDLPPVSDPADRLAMVWGRRCSRQIKSISCEEGGYLVTGYAAPPSFSRSNRNLQYFYLNSRPVSAPTLLHAVNEAYTGLLPRGRFPVLAVMVECDPALADINVHPSKREVKFRDGRTVHDIIVTALKRALASAVKPPLPRVPVRHEPMAMPSVEPTSVEAQPGTTWMPVASSQAPVVEDSETGVTELPPAQRQEEPIQIEMMPFVDKMDDVFEAPLQIFGTYLVFSKADKLLIVDQHALHERLLYETLQAGFSKSGAAIQDLLVPILIEFAPHVAASLSDKLDLFSELGMIVEDFGDNTLAIMGLAQIYDGVDAERLARDIADALIADGGPAEIEARRSWLLKTATRACRDAIKAGDLLSVEQRRELVNRFGELTPPYTCPHGRPIVTEITRVELEKNFKRRQ